MKLLRSFIDAVSSPIVVVCLIFLGHHQSLVSRVDAFGVVPNSIRSVPSKDQHALNIVPVPVTDPNRNSIRTTRADRSSLSLQIGGDGEGGGEDSASLSPSINIQLVLQNVASQALLGYTIWNGGVGRTVLTEEAHFGLGAIVYGIAGVIPMLALSRAIETSESRYVSTLNLSTNMAVLRLFGPTPQPILALLISLFLASSTGLVEETIFRGQSLPAFAVANGNDVLTGALLSTLLFAVLHTNPLSFFRGREAFLDNSVLLTLQFINGAIFAFLYILTGNLAVPIITHALYDFYIFYKTHLVDVAGQMKYAEEEILMPICSSNTVENKWIEERGKDWLKEAKEAFYLMDTNRDGELSRKELRIALYSYGINLSKVQSERVEEAADIDESGAIDFDEYLEYIGPTGSKFKAVKNTLLGPT